jgi:hypothetical protein
VRGGIAVRRVGVIVALGALLGMFGGVVTASPALARGPKWEFVRGATVTLPSSFCGFKVRVTPVSRQFVKVLKTTDGSETVLFTGTLTLSYTNLSTGKAVTEKIAATSSTFTANADGSVTVVNRGHSPLFLSPADAQRLGLPTVSVLAGRLTISTDPDGKRTSLSLHGHVLVDVCAALS